MSMEMPGMEMPTEEILPESVEDQKVEGEVNPELDAEIIEVTEILEGKMAEVDREMERLGGPEEVKSILQEAVAAETSGAKPTKDLTNKVMLASAALAVAATALHQIVGLQGSMFETAFGPLIDVIGGIAKGVGASGRTMESIGGVNDAFAGGLEALQDRIELIGMYPAVASGISAAVLKVKRSVVG